MAKKPNLSNVTNILTAGTVINNNNDLIEEAFENTLSRDGSTPNQMEADIDLNSNDLLNVKNLDVNGVLTVEGVNFNEQVSNAAQSAADAADSAEESGEYADQAAVSAASAASSASDVNEHYKTVQDLLDSTETSRGLGSIWEAQGFRYEEVSSGEHFTTVGGVKLYVLPGADGKLPSGAFPDVTSAASASLAGASLVVTETEAAITGPITPDTADSSNTLFMSGSGMFKTRLQFDGTGNGIHRRNTSNIDNLRITNTGLPETHVAVSTGDDTQSYFGLMNGNYIDGWRYGIWNRYSLWDEYRNLRLVDNACGIRLARTTYQETNADPVVGDAWNALSGNGFFNNQVTFDNVLASRGEVGIWATSMGATFMNVTTQGQDTDGTSNSVLPGAQKGTGLMLDWTGTGARGWHNVVMNHYVEDTKIGAYYKDQRHVLVNGMFMQGGPTDDRAEAAVIADNSVVEINAFTGQDYFDKLFEAKNGATLYLNSRYGPTVATDMFVTDETSRIKMRGVMDKDKYEYSFDTNGAAGRSFTLPDAIPNYAHAELYLTALYDGYAYRSGKFVISRWSSSVAPTVELLTTGSTSVSVTCSTGGIVTVTAEGSQRLVGDLLLHIVGGVGTSGTAIALTGA